ncbi:rano class II histocompatibility antigen, A beta chain-like isoform X2 [Ascaphus truei]|uniref:rano class II histocompatibility antigen, A beta chain-like isoform X2 n=1 Tax=Ascaphus truei TaxID=8439 RepID=UPI003F5ACB9B
MVSSQELGILHITVRVMAVLLTLSPSLCETPPEDFLYQTKSQCYYRNGSADIRFLYRCIYNQEEFAYFDSDTGYFIPKTELGRLQADTWNSQPDLLEDARAQVERVCKHNYEIFTPYTIDKKSPPHVKIVNTRAVSLEYENILTCYVDSFFPFMITVTWLKNGVEETEQVTSTELLQDGDWTYQIHVMLETTIQHGDSFTCRVEHSSLETPISVHWEPDTSESARNLMLTGIVGFVLGSIFIVVGLTIYLRSKKGTRFPVPQNEGLMS